MYLAAAAHCDTDSIMNWDCGINCKGNPNFEPITAGRDGDRVLKWYVGYDRFEDAAIVAHEGTEPTKLLSVLTDVEILLVPPSSSLFPGVPGPVRVHQGFAEAHSLTASQVLDSVLRVIDKYRTSTVITVGHSLGAAIALFDSVYLRLHLDPSIDIKFFGYGLPEPGNPEWADYVDALLPGKVTHITNKRDPVPIIPGVLLGYSQTSGEIRIQESGDWVVCPGHGNPDPLCSAGAVPSIVSSDPGDHIGPYDGITIQC
ncbi:Alpha/Beta hydrolase protein [Russula brevipes]|nr:Alpha/Beta hydrolase protein [Russula brevipes]